MSEPNRELERVWRALMTARAHEGGENATDCVQADAVYTREGVCVWEREREREREERVCVFRGVFLDWLVQAVQQLLRAVKKETRSLFLQQLHAVVDLCFI